MSAQLKKLNDLDKVITQLQERVDNRAVMAFKNSGDEFLNKKMKQVLEPLGTQLKVYRDFHTQHTDSNGQIGAEHRKELSDTVCRADSERLKLRELCDQTLNVQTTAPGSLQRLSPLFRNVIEGERKTLDNVQRQLKQVIDTDLQCIQRMPRNRSGLFFS